MEHLWKTMQLREAKKVAQSLTSRPWHLREEFALRSKWNLQIVYGIRQYADSSRRLPILMMVL
jgi:hypothetical protein